MNATNFHESYWREPYQVPAGILALAVHGAFFALMYLGFAWQSRPPETVNVELWQSLPEAVEEAPPVIPAVPEVLPPQVMEPAQPAEIPPPPQDAPPEKIEEPDIVVPDKKKVEKARIEKKSSKKKAAKSAVLESIERRRIEQEQAARAAAQRAELERAEQAAARSRVVNEYKARIQNKITRNIVMPPGVRDDALAVFRVTLLPGGSVLSAKMEKSSGNAAYDNAVERAILKSDPLPLPPDPALFKDFRILELKFQPRRIEE